MHPYRSPAKRFDTAPREAPAATIDVCALVSFAASAIVVALSVFALELLFDSTLASIAATFIAPAFVYVANEDHSP